MRISGLASTVLVAGLLAAALGAPQAQAATTVITARQTGASSELISWAMMVLGFGGVGAVIRARREAGRGATLPA